MNFTNTLIVIMAIALVIAGIYTYTTSPKNSDSFQNERNGYFQNARNGYSSGGKRRKPRKILKK
jgi:hypothetical protein